VTMTQKYVYLANKYYYFKCRLPVQTAKTWDQYCYNQNKQPSKVLIPYFYQYIDGILTEQDLPYFKLTNYRMRTVISRRINLPYGLNYKLKSILDKKEIQHASFMRSVIEYILNNGVYMHRLRYEN